MTRTLPAVTACVLALGLVACTPGNQDDGVDGPTDGTTTSPPAPEDGTATTPPADDAALTVPRGDTEAAELRLTGGAGSILVSGGAHADHLLEADVVGDAGPEHTETDGTHVVVLEGDTAAVRLAEGVTWEVHVQAGADDVDVDLTDVPVSRLALAGGAGAITLTLGEPADVVVIEETGGADRLTVRRPASVGVRVTVTSGVGQATVDGDLTEGVGAGTLLTTDGFDEAGEAVGGESFYDVTVAGGLGSLDVGVP